MIELTDMRDFNPDCHEDQRFVFVKDEAGNPLYYVDFERKRLYDSTPTRILKVHIVKYHGSYVYDINRIRGMHTMVFNRYLSRTFYGQASTPLTKIVNKLQDREGALKTCQKEVSYYPSAAEWVWLCAQKDWLPTADELITLDTLSKLDRL